MNEILELLIAWSPAIFGAISSVSIAVVAITKMLSALKDLKNDSTINDINNKLDDLNQRNLELSKTNNLLLDQLTKVKNYAKEIDYDHLSN